MFDITKARTRTGNQEQGDRIKKIGWKKSTDAKTWIWEPALFEEFVTEIELECIKAIMGRKPWGGVTRIEETYPSSNHNK